MKILLVTFICFCTCVKNSIAYPVFDEQTKKLIDITFKKIDYTQLSDYDFFVNLVRGNHPINEKTQETQEHTFLTLQNLQQSMDNSILDFISQIQNNRNTTSKFEFENQKIKLNGNIKSILNRTEISLASAIWIYHIIFLSEEELKNFINTNSLDKNTSTPILKSYDNYLESLFPPEVFSK